MESNNGPSSNKRQCSNYSTVIPQSVMDQCSGSGSVRSASCDKKTKKLRLASPCQERETPGSEDGRSETASFEYGNSGHSTSTTRTREMNGHSSSNSGHTGPSPIMKNVGVGANLTLTRSINNSYTAGTSSSCTSTSCNNNGTMTSVSVGRVSSYALDGGGGQGSLISNQGGPSPAPQNQQQQPSLSASATINTYQSLSDVHQHGPGPGRGSEPPASSSPSPSSQAAPNAPQAVAHFLLAQQQLAAGPNFQPSPVSNAASGSASAASAPSNKVCSQNLNGTVAVTSVPSNDSELQLYRVLQRANLLSYFDVMIELGGDDVQQLCEAGEEEFLEIMALVGMASKPLHVRRLQKSLQEWMTQPSLFPGPSFGPPLTSFSAGPMNQSHTLPTTPITEPKQEPGSTGSGHQLPIRPIPYPATIGGLHSPSGSGSTPSPPQATTPGAPYLIPNEIKNLQLKYLTLRHSSLISATNATNSDVINRSNSNSPVTQCPPSASVTSSPTYTQPAAPFPIPPQSPTLCTSSTLLSGGLVGTRTTLSSSSSSSMFPLSIPVPVPTTSAYRLQQPNATRHPFVPVTSPSPYLDNRTFAANDSERSSQVPAQSGTDSTEIRFDSRSSLSPIPFLQDNEIQKIHDAAVKVVQNLPDYLNEPRASKRKSSADYESVIKLSLDDPRRVTEIRKYSPIYGRYDCKRKVQKPLTIHELSVNEAAAQLCFRIPGLLTRRDELFQLSRQVVRDAGLPYSCIISSSVGLATGAAGNGSTNSKTFSAGSDSHSQTGSDGSCQHLNNNNNGKRVNSSEEYNRSRPELESDTSSQSQHSSCSAGSESIAIAGAAADYSSRFPFETTSRGGPHPHMNPRRDSSEPDDLTIPKPNQSQNDGSSSGPHPITVNMMMSAGMTSRSRNLRFKTEPR